ncbi:MAG: hypothetical protein U9P73_04620 [Candidatus Cloacimonadota bacterium]|nr:hypothetical protein [Candidatus Cloacimonadota bacterium]
MLQAILKGKIRGIFDKIQDGIPWRKAYSTYEDFLTASVVGRMTYLPGDILWRLVKGSSLHSHLYKYVGGLESIEFWPNWPVPDRMKNIGTHRQPDVFLKFEEIDMIVEAKRDDSLSQNHIQWSEQILSYLFKRNIEGEENRPIVFWVLGGMGTQLTEEFVNTELTKVMELVNDEYPDENIKLAVSSWGKMLSCLLDLQHFLTEELRGKFPLISPYDRRHILKIIDDIIEALRLHGIKEWRYLSEMAAYWGGQKLSDQSLNLFNSPSHSQPQKDEGQLNWGVLQLATGHFNDGLKWYGRN